MCLVGRLTLLSQSYLVNAGSAKLCTSVTCMISCQFFQHEDYPCAYSCKFIVIVFPITVLYIFHYQVSWLALRVDSYLKSYLYVLQIDRLNSCSDLFLVGLSSLSY